MMIEKCPHKAVKLLTMEDIKISRTHTHTKKEVTTKKYNNNNETMVGRSRTSNKKQSRQCLETQSVQVPLYQTIKYRHQSLLEILTQGQKHSFKRFLRLCKIGLSNKILFKRNSPVSRAIIVLSVHQQVVRLRGTLAAAAGSTSKHRKRRTRDGLPLGGTPRTSWWLLVNW